MMQSESSPKKKGKKANYAKIALIAGIFLFVFLLSEVAYILKNGWPPFTHYFIEKAQTAARKEYAEVSLNNLLVAAKINIFIQVLQYRGLIPVKYDPKISLPQENSQFKDAWLSYIKNLNLNLPSESTLARIFYTLGLLAYRNNQSSLVIPLWQTASYLEPELSHYHVELANFYLAGGDQEKATSELEFCLKFKYPVKHCQEYIDTNLFKNSPEEVGFLEKGLEDYYKTVGS